MIFFAISGGLIPILIFVAFALLARWLKKKAESEQADQYRDLPRGPQPQRPRRKSWEQELRDALENRPPPPPIPREMPPPVSDEGQGIEVLLPPPPPLPEARFRPLAGLSESEQRYEHAQNLQQRVARQLEEGTHRRGVVASVARSQRSASTQHAIRLVRNPENLRTAILANVILGPPRALEN